MSVPIIEARDISKQYHIGMRERVNKTLREAIADAFTAPFRNSRDLWRLTRIEEGKEDVIWALKDVSFDIFPGEVVGIIGRNGAGKSTLLKILSRITEPSSGEIKLKGRVASLLEVGTGFHPELTGRENIYLNGTILGMRRKEIDQKFDEIVAFSEIDKFLDTPVKRYSSGMYVRLAFAVAAHLEPEILLVDEVLAVGDAAFQKKCLGKMGEVAKEGRTILFVSHNLWAVQNLCQLSMILSQGKISFYGETHAALTQYLQAVDNAVTLPLAERKDREGNKVVTFTRVAFCDRSGDEIDQVLSGQDVLIRFYYKAKASMENASVNIAFNIRSSQGYLLANLNSFDTGNALLNIYPEGYFQCEWACFNLRSGIYDCALYCSINNEIADWLQSAFRINVEDGDFFRTGKLINRDAGDILFQHSWTSHRSED